MPRWSMDSEKMIDNEYWSNRYIIEAATMADALVNAAAIRLVERECTITYVTLTKYRVSTTAVGDDVYQIINDNTPGLKVSETQTLPLFARVRCDFNTIGGGRPSRKYWCPPLTESEQSAGVLTAAAILFFQENYVDALLALDAFVDVDGQAFGSGSVLPKVAMRQLRRGSKRKKLPIIP
jgi:hypothetical protein